MTEEWRPVEGFPAYEISSLGRLLSHHRGGPRILRGRAGRKNYRIATLCRAGSPPVQRGIHQLVAEAFIGPRPPGTQVRHLDGNNQNNSARNICYGTPSANVLDQVRHGTHRNARKTRCLRDHPFDEANTKWTATGKRACRACRAVHSRAAYERQAFRAAGIRAA